MTTAYWCVFTIILMPYVLVMVARLPTFSLQANLVPRLTSDQFTGYQQRFYWAHLNALEVVAPFSALVIIAHQLHGPQGAIDLLALSFVGLRVAHAAAYAANLGLLRSVIFFSSMICMISILIMSV